MNINELKKRIEKWEDLHTEFKEWPVHADDIARGLVAFANTDGGQFIFGVSKNRRILGVTDPDNAMQKVDNIAYNNCEPPLTVVQETVTAENMATVVVINIPKGDQRPYRTNKGDYYIRTTSGRRRASRQELLRLFQAAESLFYDETIILRASLSDLDSQSFERFLRQTYQRTLAQFHISYETLLMNLGLVKEQNGQLHPTVACLLFFGREPQKFLPYAQVAAARLPGNDLAAHPSDVKQMGGNLLDVLEESARFLRIHLQTAHRIRGFEPESHPELPEEALREILVNALAHRDYTVTAPVRILIFDNRVEVRTPGGLPNTVTIEAIKLGAAHVLRNPAIYTLFSRAGMVTGIGSGVYRAIQLIKQAKGKEPDIYLEAGELVVSLPRESNVSSK